MSFAGSFSQSIPVPVAPGRAGMQPALSLNYSSSMGNSLFGHGWSMDLTRIEREIKNGGVLYTDEDNFVLVMKGARQTLVPVGGGEYRLGIESSFLKITKNANNSWTIKDQNNTLYTLAAPWPMSGVKTFSWSLSAVADIHGNAMNYTYADGGIGHRLTRVDYGVNNSVVLYYDGARQDVSVNYRSGFRAQTSARLNAIKSFVGSVPASHVSFTYGDFAAQRDYRSLLTKVTVHDPEGKLSSRSTSYSYERKLTSSPTGHWKPAVHGVNDTGFRTKVIYSYQFNANGDKVTDGLSVVKNNTLTGPVVTFPKTFSPPFDGLVVKKLNANASMNTYPYHRAIVDMQADGYLDWMVKDSTGNWRLYSNSGSPTKVTTPGGLNIGGVTVAAANGLNTPYEVWIDPAGAAGYRAFYDVNGDGLPDLLSTPNRPDMYPAQNWTVYLNRGSYFDPNGFSHFFSEMPIPYVDKPGGVLSHAAPDILNYQPWHASIVMTGVSDDQTGMNKTVEYIKQTGINGMRNGWGHVIQSPASISLINQGLNPGIYEAPPEMVLWTVSRITNSGPNVETRSVAYTHLGAKLDSITGEFRGFANVTQTDDQTGISTTTTYDQSLILQGRPTRSVTTLNSNVLSETATTWLAKPLDNLGLRHLPYASETVSKAWDLNGDLIKDETTNATYDLFGHLLTSNTSSVGDLNKSMTNTYSGTDFCSGLQIQVAKQRMVPATIPASITNSAVYKQNLKLYNNPAPLTGRGISGKALRNAQAKAYIEALRARDWGQVAETYYVTESVTNPACWKVRRLTDSTVTTTAGTSSLTRKSSITYYPDTHPVSPGLIWTEVMEPEDSTLSKTTEYTYDSYGNRLTSRVTGAGITPRLTKTTYDINGMFPDSMENALGHSESYTWDARFGKKKTITGPNGKTTEWKYDGFGRKTDEVRADGTFSHVEFRDAPFAVTTSGSGEPPVTVRYDAMGRVIKKEAVGFGGATIYTEVEYDSLGRKYREYLPRFNEVRNNLEKYTEYAYDELSRPILITAPDSSTTSTTYNGLIGTVTNSKGQTVITEKNFKGEVVKVTDANNQVMRYEYDALGNLTKTIDASGNVTLITYDIRGRKKTMTDPNMGFWQYSYDTMGNLTSQTDAKSQVTLMTYDKLDRMIKREEGNAKVSEWFYYNGTAQVGKWIGALDYAIGPNGYKESYSYTANGRIEYSDTTVDNTTQGKNNGIPFRVSNTYDADGRIDTITYPSGLKVKQNYDLDSKGLKSVSNANNQAKVYWEATDVDELGRVRGESYYNGVTSRREYDQSTGTLTSINTGNGSIQNITYTYDQLGNLESRTDAHVNSGRAEWFKYDALNRIQTGHDGNAMGSVLYSYQYNAIGNIKAKFGVGDDFRYGELGAGPHAVTSVWDNNVKKRSYRYDANGNMTWAYSHANGVETVEREMVWTSFNKPLGITTAGGYTGFSYDADHNRVKKVTPKETTVYIGKLFERSTSKNALNPVVKDVSYIYAGGQVVTIEQNVGGAAETKYVHTDNLGSMHTITDYKGDMIERFSFDPFGAPRDLNTLAPLNDWSAGTSRGYTGHEMDASTGLINMNARLYDPVLGRFISADTVIPDPGNMQSFNRYTYVKNNPLMYTDPTGHFDAGGLIFGLAVGVMTAGLGMAIGAAIAGLSSTAFAAGVAAGLYSGAAMAGMAIAGAWTGLIMSGLNIGAAGIAAISAVVTFGIGDAFPIVNNGSLVDEFANALAHGAYAGVEAAWQGDNISAASMSAFVSAAFTPTPVKGRPANPAMVLVAGIIGGVSSNLAGGKFVDGFSSGVMIHLVNANNHPSSYPGTNFNGVPMSPSTLKKVDAATGADIKISKKDYVKVSDSIAVGAGAVAVATKNPVPGAVSFTAMVTSLILEPSMDRFQGLVKAIFTKGVGKLSPTTGEVLDGYNVITDYPTGGKE